jgi:hypothetical protein
MTVQLGGHADLAAVVGLIHRTDPAGSLFIIPITAATPDEDPAVIGTMRFTMPDPPHPAATVQIAVAVGEKLTEPGAWRAAAAVALAAYGPAAVVDPLLGLLPRFLAELMDLPVFDILRVHRGRCWSYLCPEHSRDGPGLPVDPWCDPAIEVVTELGQAQHG